MFMMIEKLPKDYPATPIKRSNKVNWLNTYKTQQQQLNNKNATMIIIGNSTAVGQTLSHHIWSKEFRDAVNLGIGGNRMENLFSRGSDLSLPALFKKYCHPLWDT